MSHCHKALATSLSGHRTVVLTRTTYLGDISMYFFYSWNGSKDVNKQLAGPHKHCMCYNVWLCQWWSTSLPMFTPYCLLRWAHSLGPPNPSTPLDGLVRDEYMNASLNWWGCNHFLCVVAKNIFQEQLKSFVYDCWGPRIQMINEQVNCSIYKCHETFKLRGGTFITAQ